MNIAFKAWYLSLNLVLNIFVGRKHMTTGDERERFLEKAALNKTAQMNAGLINVLNRHHDAQVTLSDGIPDKISLFVPRDDNRQKLFDLFQEIAKKVPDLTVPRGINSANEAPELTILKGSGISSPALTAELLTEVAREAGIVNNKQLDILIGELRRKPPGRVRG
jgi:hypothetical protein